jgi:ABC-type dipeptide/oligopeptide/nickel transport system permease subunit
MGTDILGRDLLARTLDGTLPTILNALVITGIVIIGSVSLATCLATSQKPFITRMVERMGRILSAMPTIFILFLAMYHTYPVEQMSIGNIVSAQVTWFSILGDAANQVLSIVTYPFQIYAPVLFLLITMLSASFVAHGIRGRR